MTTEVKFSGRTYGKSQQESAASKAFDDVFSKPKATNMKWGNASFVKSRVDEENETKRAKIEEPSDPFSFEFDGDRSPQKKRRIQPLPRTVVQPAVRYVVPTTTQPAVRIKTDLHDDDDDDLVVRRAPTKTYTKKSSRRVKLENDTSQQKIDSFMKTRKNSEEDTTDLSQSTDLSQETAKSSEDISEEIDPDLYIEKDDGSSVDMKDTSFLENEEDNIFKKRKKEDDNEITVRFRSRYLDPDVYSKFTENVSPKDPVGRLSNSKVVHSNVLKHDAGTTLIVVCSPKVETDIKHTNVETKYFNTGKSERKTERKTRSQAKEATQESQKEKENTTESEVDNRPEASQEDDMEVESGANALPNNTQEPEQTAMTVTPDITQPQPCSQVSEPVESSVTASQEIAGSQSSGSDLPKIIIRNKRTVTTVSKNKPVTGDNKADTGDKSNVTVENTNALGGSKTYTMTVNKSAVKVMPATPPRKFHRIFRSRNKAVAESSQEAPSSQPEPPSVTTTPDNSQRSDGGSETSGAGSQEMDVSEQSQQSSQEESQPTGTEQEDQDVGKSTIKIWKNWNFQKKKSS